MIWFWMICRVAWRVARGSGATDERSDEEGEGEGEGDEFVLLHLRLFRK